MEQNSTKRVAVVTGAAGGLGQAISAQLIGDGMTVVGMDLDTPGLELLSSVHGDRFAPVTVDLMRPEAIAGAFAGIGAVDVLVNNAGTCLMSEFPQIPAEELAAQMRINFEAAFHCCQAAVPLMLGREGVRKIVNISSNGAYNFDVFDPPHYRASKAALNMFLKTASIEIARKRPQAICLALHPGTVETPLSAPFAGDRTLLSANKAARLLLDVIDRADSGSSGSFFAYDGQKIAW